MYFFINYFFLNLSFFAFFFKSDRSGSVNNRNQSRMYVPNYLETIEEPKNYNAVLNGDFTIFVCFSNNSFIHFV